MPEKLDLGYMNGWDQKNYPVEYLKCWVEKHELTYRQVGRCDMEYTCPICGIKWNIDSSD